MRHKASVNMKKLCYLATIPAVIHAFLQDHIRASAQHYAVSIVSNPSDAELLTNLPVKFIPLAVQRKISVWQDWLVLVQLIRLFRRERFDLVHSIMPKTGLLTMLAGYIAGTPIRVHTFTGQVWANKRGLKRRFLKFFDLLIAFFATHTLMDSPSQRDFLIAEGIVSPRKAMVIGHGSICGVDPSRFHADTTIRLQTRQALAISPHATVLLFLGRLNRDKGMPELAAAFAAILKTHPETILLLVGAEEDFPFSQMQAICGVDCTQLRRVPFTPHPEHYMAAADIFCLPSHREGFGQVIIEAAATGVPTVASRIYGITDAVDDKKTGLLFPAADVAALTTTLRKLIEDVPLRTQMGAAAKHRALALFSSQKISNDMQDFYATLLP
jgi:glycosyltransferase involved in cell wall biosynthesis